MSHDLPPSLEDFERLAAEALAAQPDPIRAACAGLVVRVDDFPPDDVLDALGIADPFELTGLYQGVALTEKSEGDIASLPDVVWLYRRPILDEWADRGDVPLGALVGHILVHEIAHHFGWTEDEIAAVDRWWE